MYLPVPPGGCVMQLSQTPALLSLFVDATVVRGAQAGGAVLKDAAGQVLGTTGWRFAGQTLDSTLAEGNALEAGLAWLHELGVEQPTVVYLDAYQVLEHLAKLVVRYEALQRVRARLPSTTVVRIQNIERRRNKLADAAARAALQAAH